LIQSPAIMVNAPEESQVRESVASLSVGEKLLLGFFTYTTVAAFVFPVPLRERLTVLGLNLLAGTVLFLLSRYGAPERNPFLAALRAWLPCLLILLAYRESGLFFVPDATHRLDCLFEHWDDILLKNSWVIAVLSFCSPWLQRYLELAYLLCYPLVPLGLACLFLVRRQTTPRGAGSASLLQAIDRFWAAVLLAVLCCYAVYPLFPLTPPRELFHDVPGPAVTPLLRKTNFWILGRYGVGASLFPSGHVAGVTATALAVRAYLPRLGVVFLIAAASIALATVYGRYHYAADAVAGALVGVAAFLISNHLHRN
jgi:membrane-associated phospholipid phosphatase